MHIYALAAIMLAGVTAMSVAAEVTPVTDQQAHDWLLHVIPLPKEVTIERKVTVPVGSVAVNVAPGSSDLVRAEAVALLSENEEDAQFAILVGVLDAGKLGGHAIEGAGRLDGLRNSEQAYLIRSLDDRTLAVTGLSSAGVFYGLKTLRQFIEPTLTGEGADATVDIPLGSILDWPDLAERGEWGGSANRDIEWMAERKMNLVETHCKSLQVTDEGRGVAEFDKTLIERGAACAVKVVPIITHLDQLERTGLFRVFPQTLGEGDPKTWPYGGTTVKPACFSKPETARVLGDWMVSLAEQPEVTDISVWLSEHHVACACEECQKKGQFTLEAEAVARGYELAREVRPDIRLRVLLTQGSYEFNDQVIAALPPEIGITYYDGGKTYDSSRKEMIYPLLEEYAAAGGWLGCYPQLTASWRIVCPWSGPQFVRFRMTEFVDDGLECLCGYATPDNRFYDFNINAAAEWSWNCTGRDEREFALAYFTKRGVPDPSAAADWAVMLGPVGWDVYGARVPYNWFFGAAARGVAKGNLPALGAGPFVYMPDDEHLAEDLRVCAAAMALAEGLGEANLIAETQTIEGYVKMLKSIHELGELIGKKRDLSDEEKQAATAFMAELDAATRQTVEGLKTWQQAVAPDRAAGRVADTCQVTKQTTAQISDFLVGLGIEDPERPYRMQKIGAWHEDDFAEGARITKTWEVTDRLGGPGTYRAQFNYTRGWYALHIYSAALMSAPRDNPEDLTEVVVDAHEGSAAAVGNAHDFVYTFEVTEHNPELRYFLVADVRGISPDHPADKQGCRGEVTWWKVRPDAGD
jgi:hypothetical protein